MPTHITLFSGSTLGNAEYVAEHLEELLQTKGFETTLLHGPSLHDLPLSGVWLVICSTHGSGDVPDNLQPLVDQLITEKPDLSAIRFGAIGLGSSEYDLFCGAIKTLEQTLITLGGKLLGEKLEIDTIQDELPEVVAEAWLPAWLELI